MTRKQKERMQSAIYNLKRENALNKMIMNPHEGLTEVMDESRRRFIYIELPNTKPVVAYAFNESDNVIIGRNPEECTIVINDIRVSRTQCMIFAENEMVYVQDMNAGNPSILKTGWRKQEISGGEAVPIFEQDILVVGDIKLYVALVRGDGQILN